MRKPKTNSTVSPTECRLLEALERLRTNQPRHPDLVRKSKLGKLRINVSAVVLEAGEERSNGKWKGLSRTLIGHDGCAYPRVRALVKEAQVSKEPVTSFEDVNRKLRIENAELRKTVMQVQSQMAAMIRRMDQVDIEAERRIKEVKRQAEAKYRKTDPNQIAASKLLRRREAHVIPFPPSETGPDSD